MNPAIRKSGEIELSFRLITSLTRSHTKPRTVSEEVILDKGGISLKDNFVSPST